MKKLAKVITALVLIMAMMVPIFASASAESGSRTMYVKTTTHQRLNMRFDFDSTNPDSVILTIPYGAPVKVFEIMKDGRWAFIQYGDRVGYVVTRCLANVKPAK